MCDCKDCNTPEDFDPIEYAQERIKALEAENARLEQKYTLVHNLLWGGSDEGDIGVHASLNYATAHIAILRKERDSLQEQNTLLSAQVDFAVAERESCRARAVELEGLLREAQEAFRTNLVRHAHKNEEVMLKSFNRIDAALKKKDGGG